MSDNIFENLYAINVNDKTEDKDGLTYLSWAWAWAEVKKVYPEATYNIKRFDRNLPYVYDENTGYMVFTDVTIDGLTHEMWLPVMDGHNKAMKSRPYTVKTKYKEIPVNAATMFDINKAIMRCLTKNLAMFGLGLYIYAGEDLPDMGEPEEPVIDLDSTIADTPNAVSNLKNMIATLATMGATAFEDEIKQTYGIERIEDLKKGDYRAVVQIAQNKYDMLKEAE